MSKLRGKAYWLDRLVTQGKITLDEIPETAKHKPFKDAVKASQDEKSKEKVEKEKQKVVK